MQCLVVGVSDGDTLKARCGALGSYQQVKVRIAAIDAPESGQAYGQRAKQALSDLCFQQAATLRPIERDRYGRTVADVNCRQQDAGHHMVSTGMAWVYTRYARNHSALPAAQEAAVSGGRGLWVDASATPPWDWRRNSR